jgi:hypothetical protein
MANYPQLRELFTPGINIIRDQHRGSWHHVKQEVLGIPQMDSYGNKYRYQVVGTPEASYMLHFDHTTPSLIRLQMNNGHVSDALRYGVCYPPGTRIVSVTSGLFKSNHEPGSVAEGRQLSSSSSFTSLSFLSGDSYYWDSQRNMILVTLKQRYERHMHDAYCPLEGCEQVWIQANVPSDSGSVSCGDVAYPHYQITDGPFFDRKLLPIIAPHYHHTLNNDAQFQDDLPSTISSMINDATDDTTATGTRTVATRLQRLFESVRSRRDH